jgi:hypothetical protein
MTIPKGTFDLPDGNSLRSHNAHVDGVGKVAATGPACGYEALGLGFASSVVRKLDVLPVDTRQRDRRQLSVVVEPGTCAVSALATRGSVQERLSTDCSAEQDRSLPPTLAFP